MFWVANLSFKSSAKNNLYLNIALHHHYINPDLPILHEI